MRADEWWEYKLVPILSTFYATALVLRVAVSSLWVGAATLLLATLMAAIFASAINEITDRADDLAAGKRNRAAEHLGPVSALLAFSLGVALIFAWLWRNDATLLSCYLAIFLAFALYSIPPVRLKKRGLSGVLCDAAGEQMFPALAAAFMACHYANGAVSYSWLASVAAWSLAYGLRGIIWHQLTDVENDRAAGILTFARRNPGRAARIGTFIVFPLELCAFAVMLWQIGSSWPPACLVLYVLYAAHSARRSGASPVIVAPKPRFFIVLLEFYSHLFPVSLLIAASIRHPRDLVVLVIHLILFPRRAFHTAGRIASTVRSSISNRRVNASTASTVVNASEPHHGGVG